MYSDWIITFLLLFKLQHFIDTTFPRYISVSYTFSKLNLNALKNNCIIFRRAALLMAIHYLSLRISDCLKVRKEAFLFIRVLMKL
jgi:hypothetical protein